MQNKQENLIPVGDIARDLLLPRLMSGEIAA